MGLLFKKASDSENNSRIHKNMDKWLYYTEGYKIAAEQIENFLLDNPDRQDYLIYPLVYSYRHYIELKLKEIIVLGDSFLGNISDFHNENHNLIKLWIRFQKTLKSIPETNYQAPSTSIATKIQEFHDADTNSDGFRYPINQKGKQNLESLKIINFRNFKNEISEIKEYLESIADSLYVIRDSNSINI